MQLLILGASSNIGAALARVFAPGNTLILAGRNVDRLAHTVALCKESGAADANYVEVDFQLGIAPLLTAIAGKQIDLIIDAASASSRLRDSDLSAGDITNLVSADFHNRTKLFEQVCGTAGPMPAVIFISTVLTLVKSPDRTVYTTLKTLYEAYLLKLKEGRPDFHLLVVYVGVVINREGPSKGPESLAAAVARSFQKGDDKLLYGTGGRMMVGLYYLQPLVYGMFTLAQRKVRRLFDPRS
ncbi:MAG: hypothetical protein RLZZ129_2233 [Verrucomicrobiota bacterium]|jgi:short-subunit dehydrogenase